MLAGNVVVPVTVLKMVVALIKLAFVASYLFETESWSDKTAYHGSRCHKTRRKALAGWEGAKKQVHLEKTYLELLW